MAYALGSYKQQLHDTAVVCYGHPLTLIFLQFNHMILWSCSFPATTSSSRASAGSFPLPSQPSSTSRRFHLLSLTFLFRVRWAFRTGYQFGWARSPSIPPYLYHSIASLVRVCWYFFRSLGLPNLVRDLVSQ